MLRLLRKKLKKSTAKVQLLQTKLSTYGGLWRNKYTFNNSFVVTFSNRHPIL